MFKNILTKGLLTVFEASFGDNILLVQLAAILVCVIAGYLLGSLNSAIIVSRLLYGEDVRTKGSGNAGLTNMMRIYGKKAAVFTLLGDVLKAALAVLIGGIVFGFYYRAGMAYGYMGYVIGFFCILGHIKPVFYGFRGGKGILCTATVFAILAPFVFLFLLVAFVLIVWMTKYVSLGSVVCGAFLPLALRSYMEIFTPDSAEYGFDGILFLIALAYAVTVIVCHRKNIKRLWNHEENKFSFHSQRDETGEDQK